MAVPYNVRVIAKKLVDNLPFDPETLAVHDSYFQDVLKETGCNVLYHNLMSVFRGEHVQIESPVYRIVNRRFGICDHKQSPRRSVEGP